MSQCELETGQKHKNTTSSDHVLKRRILRNHVMHYSCIKFDYLEDSDAQLISDRAFICPE